MIEILTVTAILGVMVVLLLPAVNRMSVEGKKAACVSNLRTIGSGMMLYVGENNGRFPDNGTSATMRWMHQISPYIGSVTEKDAYSDPVFHCPLQRRSGDQFFNAERKVVTVYAANKRVCAADGREPGSGTSVGVNMMKLTNATRLVAVSERAWNAESAGDNRLSEGGPYPQNKAGVAANHRPDSNPANGPDGPANYLFADGHVETLTIWPGVSAFRP